MLQRDDVRGRDDGVARRRERQPRRCATKTGEDGGGERHAEALTHDACGGEQTGYFALLSGRRGIHQGARVRRLEHSLPEPDEHQAADDLLDRAVRVEPRQQQQTHARDGEPSRRQPA